MEENIDNIEDDIEDDMSKIIPYWVEDDILARDNDKYKKLSRINFFS